MTFRILGLPADNFTHLFALSDSELAAQGGVRRTVDGKYPCGSASRIRRLARSFC
jgi:hypothetical protein